MQSIIGSGEIFKTEVEFTCSVKLLLFYLAGFVSLWLCCASFGSIFCQLVMMLLILLLVAPKADIIGMQNAVLTFFINFYRQGVIGAQRNGPLGSGAALASNANPNLSILMQVDSYIVFLMDPIVIDISSN